MSKRIEWAGYVWQAMYIILKKAAERKINGKITKGSWADKVGDDFYKCAQGVTTADSMQVEKIIRGSKQEPSCKNIQSSRRRRRRR